jgi:hypothetical protein
MNIFIIYARKDKEALDELRAHLKSTEATSKLNIWYDGEILPGQDWNEEIQTRLESANISLLLISKDFFNSDYIEKEELAHVIVRHENNHCVIIPIIVKDCVWEDHFSISKFQVLPNNATPVYSNKWHDSDEAWTDVVRGIKTIVKLIREGRPPVLPSIKIENISEGKSRHAPVKHWVKCQNCNGNGVHRPFSVLLPDRICLVCKGTGKVEV